LENCLNRYQFQYFYYGTLKLIQSSQNKEGKNIEDFFMGFWAGSGFFLIEVFHKMFASNLENPYYLKTTLEKSPSPNPKPRQKKIMHYKNKK
jgi:hypothetical protein